MDVTFLYAPQRLCKTIKQLADGEIEKSAYPLAKNFTSETVEVNNLLDFYKALSSRAVNPKKPCLIKGRLSRPLISESRRNTTNTNDKTQFIVLDPDEAPFSSPEELMRALKLQDISYVVQYSSSYKLKQSKKLSCHIFIMLDRPMAAPALKAWLMQMNLDVQVLRNALTLSNSRAALKWALDITSCQNDRLIYIAEPDFHGMKAPIKPNERILYVKKERDRLDISRLSEKALDVLKKEARTELIRLQTAAGMTPLRNKPRMQGEYLVQHGVAEVGQFEVVDEDDEFVRLNLNGGDSAAYWHYRTDFELLHNFKGEDSVKLKEILPEYYKELVNRRKTEEKALKAQRATPSPSNDGDQLLCFRDKHTGSYFNGTYNVGLNKLDLFPAKNERQCEHFMMSHGEVNVDFIPIWERIFDPTTDVVVDFDARTINMWCPSDYIKNARTVKEPKLIDCPIIQKILDSAVGIGPIQDHFLNWLAVLMQHRAKPRTAWVLHGTQGCLAAETKIRFRRGKRNSGREITIKEAYEKWTGGYKAGQGRCRAWDLNLKTYAPSVKDNLTVGYHEVFKILEAGVKTLYRVETSDGGAIRITHEHPFMRPDGSFTKLCDLNVGDEVLKEGSPLQHIKEPKGRNKQRKTIHSIEYHPFAWKHIIGGKNYKRTHKARLVVEADINGLSFDDYIWILRNDPIKAKSLQYLQDDVVVHHLDEDCSNDTLSNLTVINKLNHDQHHAKHTGLGTISTRTVKIVSITKAGDEMTYDMVMKAPYHNYVANGFCVSNTGKGLLVHNVLAPIFGSKYTPTRMQNELKSDFSSFIEFAMLVFIDEIEAGSLEEGGQLEAKLKYYITEPVVPIRRMRTDSYEVNSYCGWVFGSNKVQPVVIPRNDRRYNVGQFQKKRLEMTLDEVEVELPKELQAFTNYLVSRKADKERAAKPLLTEDRETLMALSENSLEKTANAILTGDLEAIWEAMPDEVMTMAQNQSHSRAVSAAAYIQFVKRALEDAHNKRQTRLTRDELGMIFDWCCESSPKSPNKLTQFLRHQGIVTQRLRNDEGKLCYGIDVTWEFEPAFLKDVYKPPKPQPRARGERALQVVEGRRK